jgi:phosphatidate cytidylyltransferase
VLARRILTGVPAAAFLIFAALDGGWLFRTVILLAGLIGVGEALWMCRQAGYRPVQPFAYLLLIAILADAALARPIGAAADAAGWPTWLPLAQPQRGQILQPALGITVLGSMASLFPRTEFNGSLSDWALTLALPLYVGLLQFFVLLRLRADGGTLGPIAMTWPVMVLGGSWVCDIAAYAIGKLFGRARLAPLISPAKSVEGAAAGVIAAMMLGVLLHFATGLHPLLMAGFGFAVGIGSVIGDLAESLLKRQCGVKDSGVLMPGHGGLLDRMDALLGAATCAYFYLEAVG